YFDPAAKQPITIFPTDATERRIPAPEGLPPNARVIGFSADGKGTYVQQSDPLNRSIGIQKIEFGPLRINTVPGSVGLGEVYCFRASLFTVKLVVAGWSWQSGTRGTFEIDPISAHIRAIPAGNATACGGEAGLLSPDGKRALLKTGRSLIFPSDPSFSTL